MLGAIIGDIVGSIYEFDNTNRMDFPFFSERSTYTDDSIMTVAVAEWLLSDNTHSHDKLEEIMVKYANEYPCPMGGYGGGFRRWLFAPQKLRDFEDGTASSGRRPYNSWGNGSAMRVSAVGWMYDTLEETERVAELSASITHNHPEGIKGAQATAAAIFMGRTGATKEDIREYIQSRFGYDLSLSWDDIHPTYGWEDSCQGTVPPAIIAFLDSCDFEDAIRRAVALGGDSDTLACITGGIAEAFYKDIPQRMIDETMGRLTIPLRGILDAFGSVSRYGSLYDSYVKPTAHDRYTPDNIKYLKENEIFVFGSNLDGMHGGGAARVAHMTFGAIWGQGVGLQGRSYAIPTMHGGVESIRPYVDEFITFAQEHPEMTFLVTRIGCGIAGFTDEQIAPLFIRALEMGNVVLPRTFVNVLKK
jgi:ADP-ribosylglycohydrolase